MSRIYKCVYCTIAHQRGRNNHTFIDGRRRKIDNGTRRRYNTDVELILRKAYHIIESKAGFRSLAVLYNTKIENVHRERNLRWSARRDDALVKNHGGVHVQAQSFRCSCSCKRRRRRHEAGRGWVQCGNYFMMSRRRHSCFFSAGAPVMFCIIRFVYSLQRWIYSREAVLSPVFRLLYHDNKIN